MTYLVISGLAGAGKSEIARPLARELGLPLFAKDALKETLWDCLDGPNDVEWSRRLGRAANEVMVSVAGQNTGGVLDSFFRREWAVDILSALPGDIVEIFCECLPDEARRRYAARTRHPAHTDALRIDDPDLWGDFRNEPLFANPIIVDTTRPVDLDELVVAIRACPNFSTRPVKSTPALILMTGLPGTGKSTIAAQVGAAIGATVIAHDITEAALLRTGIDKRGSSVAPAYELLNTLACEQLVNGQAVILDSVIGQSRFRGPQAQIADDFGVPLVVVECVCSDEVVHRTRVESRSRDIPGWYEPDWDEVGRIRSHYEPWTLHRLVVDAADPLDQNIANIKRYVLDALSAAGEGGDVKPFT